MENVFAWTPVGAEPDVLVDRVSGRTADGKVYFDGHGEEEPAQVRRPALFTGRIAYRFSARFRMPRRGTVLVDERDPGTSPRLLFHAE